MLNTIVHEIGHALGLAHDNCQGGLMVQGSLIPDTAKIDPDHCSAIEATQKINCSSTWLPQLLYPRTYCPAGCECPNGYENPDDPLDGLEPCDALPVLCPDESPYPWYQGFATVDCYSTSHDYGTGTYIEVICREVYYYSGTGLPTPAEMTTLDGVGPAIQLTSLSEGAKVAGQVAITGTAVAQGSEVQALAFWVDHRKIDLANFAKHVPSAASCAHPAGGSDPGCPRIGFSGTLDTTALSEGVHELKIVAVDTRNPYPRPTLLTRQFIVDNVCDDQIAPSGSVTAPVPGAVVSGGVQVTASVSDNVGVTKVDFLIDGVSRSTDSTAPFTYSWDSSGAAAGSHTVRLRVHDACGNSALSPLVTFTVQQDIAVPQISLTAPAGGSWVRGTSSLQAQASDDVGIARVEFYIGNVLKGTDTSAPYSYSWNTAASPDGTHGLLAKAFDTSGKVGNSPGASVRTDNTAPQMYTDYPAPNQTVSGSGVKVSGWATDGSGTAAVSFKMDGYALPLNGGITWLDRHGVCDTVPTGDPNCPRVGWRAYFDSTRLTNGWHTLEVTTMDAAGGVASQKVNVYVSNAVAPVVLRFTPTDDAWVRQSFPAMNYGSSTSLGVRATSTGDGGYSFLKFNLGGVDGTVLAARLLLRTQSSAMTELYVYRIAETSWTQGSINWSNAPGSSGYLTHRVHLAANTWYDFDVLGHVLGNGIYALGIASGDPATGLGFTSKETAYAPVLEIVYRP